MGWIVSERDGKVALTLGFGNNWDEPFREREWIVGKAQAQDNPGIIGKRVEFTGNVGKVYDDRLCRYRWIYTDDEAEWHREVEREPVRKPRRGDGFDWEWYHGRWTQVRA